MVKAASCKSDGMRNCVQTLQSLLVWSLLWLAASSTNIIPSLIELLPDRTGPTSYLMRAV